MCWVSLPFGRWCTSSSSCTAEGGDNDTRGGQAPALRAACVWSGRGYGVPAGGAGGDFTSEIGGER